MTQPVQILQSSRAYNLLMAKSSWNDGKRNTEAIPKKTSIGNGRRKTGSYKWKSQKKYRGQGR